MSCRLKQCIALIHSHEHPVGVKFIQTGARSGKYMMHALAITERHKQAEPQHGPLLGDLAARDLR